MNNILLQRNDGPLYEEQPVKKDIDSCEAEAEVEKRQEEKFEFGVNGIHD